ncbi:hypothetical protein F1880_008721 [Penicillium rolfsii]|nr:hypothetical protein F1880_008721 [Penicillium rolfsii]
MLRSAWLFLCLLASWARADSNSTEVDLIFPRNDTFAPMPLMPIVFAVQNPSVAKQVNARIEYGFHPIDRSDETVFGHTDNLADISTNETIYFSVSGIGRTFNTTGTWELFWRLRWTNCSISEDPAYYNNSYPWISSGYSGDSLNNDQVYHGFHISAYNIVVDTVVFSIHDGASNPNLKNLTNDRNCDKASALALPSVVDSLRIPPQLPQTDIDTVSMCPKIANSTLNRNPIPSPCRVSISPEAESSILAQITDKECKNEVAPAVKCPSDQPKEGSAAVHDPRQAAWLAVALAYIFGAWTIGY